MLSSFSPKILSFCRREETKNLTGVKFICVSKINSKFKAYCWAEKYLGLQIIKYAFKKIFKFRLLEK